MKKSVLFISMLFCAVSVFAAEDFASNLPVERFALYIGCNDGGKSRERLLYAGSDAYNFQKTMAEIGGVPVSNSQLLINPDKDDIIYALNGFSAKIEKRKAYTKRTEFIFYYSGHSDEDSLLLGTTAYDYSSLKKAITEVPSDVHVVILDSCFSGNFIRAKGGKRSQAFLTDDSTIVQGHAYLSSSSSSESSQESDEIQSSFFTNAMLTGLRGAADTSRDNKVSLNELYYYAFNETISKTQNSAIGPQHPSYNITLVGSGDLILTDISQAESTVILQKNDSGRFIFRNSRGVLVSEINKVAGNQVSIALESDEYEVTVIGANSTKQGRFMLKKDETYVVSTDSLKTIKRVKNTLRGDEQVEGEDGDDVEKAVSDNQSAVDNDSGDSDSKKEYDDKVVEFSSKVNPNAKKKKKNSYDDEFENDFEFDNQFSDEIDDDIDSNLFSDVDDTSDGYYFKFGLVPPLTINIQTRRRDASISLLVNSDEHINNFGFQFALIGNNVVGKMSGVQIAPIYNFANSVYGIQHATILNYTKGLSGLQLGLVNKANFVSGLQMGLFNMAKTLRGVQIGFINFGSHADGLVLGLFNFITDGVHEVSFYWDTNNLFSWQYRGGTKEFYTTISYSGNDNAYGNNPSIPYYAEVGLGFGSRAKIGWFYFDSEAIARLSVGDDYERRTYVVVYPSLRETLTLGTGFFGVFCGISFDFFFVDSRDVFYSGRYDNAWVKSDVVHIAPTFNWGFKFF